MTSDFADMLVALNAFDARYLIVAGYAVMSYTEPRFTKDLDVWVATDEENAERTFRALAHFGAPITGYTASDFMDTGSWFQVGVPPVRIDILMSITGVEFEAAWPRRVEGTFHGVPAHFISREDLIAAKRASGRPQDKRDIKQLLKPPRSLGL